MGIYVSRRGVGVGGWAGLFVALFIGMFWLTVIGFIMAAIFSAVLIAGAGMLADFALMIFPRYRHRRNTLGPISWPKNLVTSTVNSMNTMNRKKGAT
jgi:hypothetical protein